MEKTNLIATLRTFEKKELRDLRKWLLSPAHNIRQDVVSLFDYIATGEHLFSEKHLAKPKAFKAVYPDKTFSDEELRQAMHFLFREVENFLVYNEVVADEVRTQAMLAKVYRQRQLPKLFKKAIETGQRIQSQLPYRNHQYFENEYMLQFEQYSFISGQGRNLPYNLQEVSDANDRAYLANKLQLSCFMLAHQAVFKTEYEMKMLPELLSKIESDPSYLQIPAIAIYYYGLQAISSPAEEKHYHALRKQIDQHSSLFPKNELRVIFLMAINYCIGRINAGMNAFVRESFELYRDGLVRDIFLENGVLSRFTFNNAITAALNLKEFAWVEDFIGKYSGLLEEKHRENFVHFNQARLFYERRNYGEAMRLFAQSDYDDFLMTLNAKTMLLKMYYELDEINALESLLSSMRTYLLRKKVMGYHKTNYKNIVSATQKLLRVNPFGNLQKEKLKAELEALTPLTERKWLLEQLEKM